MRHLAKEEGTEIRRYFVPTPRGEVSLVFAPVAAETVTVFIHGAARNSNKLAPWIRRGSALIELPGHGVAPYIEGDAEAWASEFESAIAKVWPGASITLVGESLGGIIAMHMSADRTFCLDPPMQPTAAVEREIRYGNVAEFLRPMVRSTYWNVLDNLQRPINVICASEGILPAQAKTRLSQHPMVIYDEISGGHLLLDERRREVEFALNRQKEHYESPRSTSTAKTSTRTP